jgi:ornithine carbamoyltransferase
MPKHFLSLADWPAATLKEWIKEAVWLKREYRAGGNQPVLRGKALAMVFQKPSLRTRVSFEMAMEHLGGHALYIGAHEIEMGRRESIPDVVRTLGGYVHGIVARVQDHADLLQMAEHSPVPIINGLTNYDHPCQAMADVLTMYEEFGRLEGLRVAYLGDSDNDVTRALLFAAAKFGFQLIVSSPAGHTLAEETLNRARTLGGANVVRLIDDPVEAVSDVDVIYTDTWVWFGLEAAEAERRLRIFPPYQVNETLLAHARLHAIVLHCMPANRGQEITDSVADGPRSRLFEQAENRLHAQKAILVRLLGG